MNKILEAALVDSIEKKEDIHPVLTRIALQLSINF